MMRSGRQPVGVRSWKKTTLGYAGLSTYPCTSAEIARW